jgi:hypothetical protein
MVEGTSQAVLESSDQLGLLALGTDLKSQKGLYSGPSPIHKVTSKYTSINFLESSAPRWGIIFYKIALSTHHI